jgi:AAHS family 4-hydroxybenzoate transporter-like MFS transporter
LQFLVLQGKKVYQVTKWLRRIDPGAPVSDTTVYVVREEKKGGILFVNLFHDGRAAATTLLWAVFFLNLLNLYLLSSWLPTLVATLGYSTSDAVLVGSTLQVGGVIGAFVNAALVRRLGIMTLLPLGLTVGCVSVALIGQLGYSLALLFIVVFLAGWGIPGSQGMLNTFAGTYYPTYLRSTGVGWCLGIGRTGAVIGPLFAGELLRRQWDNAHLFLAAASLALIAAAVIFSLRFVLKPTKVPQPAPAKPY